jgi:hypothetical protein
MVADYSDFITMADIPNTEVADSLAEVGRLLAEQGANVYRVRAYEQAAATVRALGRPVAEILGSEGMAGLDKLPGIGTNLAHAIRDLVLTGRLPMLERLRGEGHSTSHLAAGPGSGARTARHLPAELEHDSLEELDVAAHADRPADSPQSAESPEPPIAEILEIDREYREKATAGLLYRITPRLHNPRHEAWLPVLHAHRGERHYTALFSNTGRAHQLGMTSDWVVVYHDGAGRPERQCTVITAQFGPLAGRRVVRGREGECASYYAQTPPAHQAPSQACAMRRG